MQQSGLFLLDSIGSFIDLLLEKSNLLEKLIPPILLQPWDSYLFISKICVARLIFLVSSKKFILIALQ